MTSQEIHKLVSIIEDLICFRVDIDEFEEIMPKISQLMYKRYCGTDTLADLKNNIENKTIEIMKDSSKAEELLIKAGIYNESGELNKEYKSEEP